MANPKSARSSPTSGFKPDVEIEFSAREVFVPILNSGSKTKVQKYFAKLLKGPDEQHPRHDEASEPGQNHDREGMRHGGMGMRGAMMRNFYVH